MDVNVADKNGETALHWAAKKGSLECLQIVINTNTSINVQDSNGNTPFHLAIEEGRDITIVEALANACPDLTLKNQKGDTALHMAVKLGKIEYIQILAKETALNVQNSEGNTPLHLAIIHQKHISIVETLMNFGPNLYIRNKSGKTVLHCAVEENLPLPIWNILLQPYENAVNVPFMLGNAPTTALHFAVRYGYKYEKVNALIKSGANGLLMDNEGRTPLHLAVSRYCKLDIILLLLNHFKPSVHLKDNLNDTALNIAVRECDEPYIRALLEAGSDISSIGNKRRSFLNEVAKQTSLHCLIPELYSQYPSFFNLKDGSGKYPLHFALQNGCSWDIFKTLFRDIDVTAKGNDQKNFLHCAVNTVRHFFHCAVNRRCDLQIVQELLKHTFLINERDCMGLIPLQDALLSNCSLEVFCSFIQANSNVFSIANDNRTSLHCAAQGRCDVAIIRRLIEYDNNWLNMKDNKGNIPLHLAAENFSSLEVMHTLVKHGSDALTLNSFNQRPLHLALFAQDRADPIIVKFLISLYPKSSSLIREDIDYIGKTYLHTAVANDCCSEIIRILINNGSNVFKFNRDGEIPLHLASGGFSNYKIIKELVRNAPTSINVKSQLFERTPLMNALDHDLCAAEEMVKWTALQDIQCAHMGVTQAKEMLLYRGQFGKLAEFYNNCYEELKQTKELIVFGQISLFQLLLQAYLFPNIENRPWSSNYEDMLGKSEKLLDIVFNPSLIYREEIQHLQCAVTAKKMYSVRLFTNCISSGKTVILEQHSSRTIYNLLSLSDLCNLSTVYLPTLKKRKAELSSFEIFNPTKKVKLFF